MLGGEQMNNEGRKNFARAGYTATAEYCPKKSCSIARALARLGNATDVDFVLALNITLSKFHSWKCEHPEFAQATKVTTTVNIEGMERAMLKCALGFSYQTSKVITTREGPIVRRVAVHAPPNVEALEFLLPVRLPQLYGSETVEGPFDRLLKDFDKRKPSSPAAQSVASNEPVVSVESLDDEICRVAHLMACLWAHLKPK
jgi:hypothetical protein